MYIETHFTTSSSQSFSHEHFIFELYSLLPTLIVHSKYFRHVILMSFFYCLGHMISRHISNENFGLIRYIFFFFFKTHKFESDYHCVFFFFWHASHILPHIFPSLNFNTNIVSEILLSHMRGSRLEFIFYMQN